MTKAHFHFPILVQNVVQKPFSPPYKTMHSWKISLTSRAASTRWCAPIALASAIVHSPRGTFFPCLLFYRAALPCAGVPTYADRSLCPGR